MAKKKKASLKKGTAGNSRLPLADDVYRPFEEAGKIVPQKIQKVVGKPAQKPPVIRSERKEPIVKGYDPQANFGDILAAWETTGELGGVTARMKSHSKVKIEKSFAEILAEWDGEKVQAKEQKKKAEPIHTSKKYVPQKDFGSLLDEFEGVTPKKDRSVPPSQRPPAVKNQKMIPSKEIEQALQDKAEDDNQKESGVSWSFADTYRQWNKVADEQAALERSQREKREAQPAFRSVSALRAMEPEDTLDLHGMTVREAEEACTAFLQESAAKKLRKIAIITGKGLHNESGVSLLKDVALSAIRLSGVVTEAYTPKAIYGGSGAIWIILKKA